MKHVKTFLSLLDFLKNEYGEKIALSTFNGRVYDLVTYGQLVDDSKHFAKFLTKRINKANFKIAIVAENNILWSRYAFGALLAGTTIIPVDIALSSNEVSNLLGHANPDLVIYSQAQEDLMKEAIKSGISEAKTLKMVEDFNHFPLFNHILLSETDPSRNAFIVYTSGSSGKAKGVMLSEEAIIFETIEIGKKLALKRLATLSMLPINHMFEFTAGLCANLACGAEICIANSLDIDALKRDFANREINQMVTVPLLISKIKAGIEKNVKKKGTLARFVFKSIFSITNIISSDKVRRILFKFIHKNLAPKLERLIVGGAKTPIQDLEFFNRLGISIFEGYGLTETAPVIATNSPDGHKTGSVGRALPGVEVRINQLAGPDYGEIQVRGKNVMMGYYKNDELTKDSFTDDGWFKTGDIGNIDQDGYVKVSGRIKSLIVLEGGKKIHPEEIEERFNILSEIKDVSVSSISTMINGKMQTHVVYILVPSDDLVSTQANDWTAIEAILNNIANEVMKQIAPYKRANKIYISREELPKTSTKKIKQTCVKDILEELTKISTPQSLYNISTKESRTLTLVRVLAIPAISLITFLVG